MIEIKHTHEDGTLVYGTSKGDGVYELIGPRTLARFRFFPSIRMIGIPQSRDRLAKRGQIDSARKALEAAGFEVTVDIDDTPRGGTEVKADRADRLDIRADRLTAKAARRQAEGDARHAAADRISERFAGGQPILAGHHSERGARADHKRMEGHDRAANAAYQEAERAAAAASVVGRAEAYREHPPVIIRRIDRQEAELRQTVHYIDGTRPANDWRGAYGYDREPAAGEWLEQLTVRRAFLEQRIAEDRAALAEHEAAGYIRLTRETVHKGDTVTWSTRFGESATVTRVNPKTVTLNRRNYPRTLPYEQIKTVECPHQGTTTEVKTPRRPAQPRPAPAPAERPAERAPVLTVDASTEFFPTPAAVVLAMTEALSQAGAPLGSDMVVLEPSAGAGAIAKAVAPAVAAVDCIERDGKLAGLLREAGFARSVRCADFLEIPPGPAYDAVLMNPPFSKQADIAHVTHAVGFLKPGGVLVAVMSAGAEFRSDKTATAFRELVADHGGWIERLPDDAFAVSGLSVSTVLAVIPQGCSQ